jgi:carbon monoxide dehydrogenase subunit G
MHLEKSFLVERSRDDVVEILCQEQTLLSLFPSGENEVVDRSPDRITTRTHYSALGREGVATFHFDFLMDGNIRFEKVCDGRVWRSLRGEVDIEERGSRTRVQITLDGATKSLVPEFAIKGPMEEQIGEMASAMRSRLEPSRA